MGEQLPIAVPTAQLGIAYPLPLADTVYWQFWRTCGFDTNLVVSHFEVESFDRERVEESVPGMLRAVRQLAQRGADRYRITGVPVLSALGRPRALDVAAEAADLIGHPVGLDFEDTVAALEAVGCRKYALAAKWEPALMQRAVDYLAHAGLTGEAVSSVDFRPDSLWRITTDEGVQLALELGRNALTRVPDADALFLAGGAWLSVAAVPILEAEFDRPVITNLNATYWRFLREMDWTSPYHDVGRLFHS